MKSTVKRGSKTRLKTMGEAKRDVGKTAKKTKTARGRTVSYPIAETLRWVAEGEILLVKWGAIKSPGAKRIAGTVGKVLSVLEALMELRK
jgi:hypothetical protein